MMENKKENIFDAFNVFGLECIVTFGDTIPINVVTHNGEPVTHNGEYVTHTENTNG